MICALGNVSTTVTQATAEEIAWLRDFLAFPDRRGIFARKDRKPGVIRLFSLGTQQFPTGLYPRVRKEALMQGFTVEKRDLRRKPCERDLDVDLSWLDQIKKDSGLTFQREAVESAIRVGRGLIKAGTGSGKTAVAVAIMASLPCRWLFLADSTQLCAQAAERLSQFVGEKSGLIGEGRWTEQRVTCATFQTLYSKLRKGDPKVARLLAGVGGIICDEVHCAPSTTFDHVLSSAENAYFRFGLSATPFGRSDGLGFLVAAAFGPVVYSVPSELLIEHGIIAKPTVRTVRCHGTSDKATYQGVYADLVVRGRRRNTIAVLIAQYIAEKPCLMFVSQLAHGQALTKALEKRGVRVEFIFGDKSLRKREGALKKAARGELDVIVANKVFYKGIDESSIASTIIVTAGRSEVDTLQRVGRAMRRGDGKTTCTVYEFEDHGHPFLEAQFRARMRFYRREGYDAGPLQIQHVELAEKISSLEFDRLKTQKII